MSAPDLSPARQEVIEGPHKVLVVGNSAVGKTSLIVRYTHATFSPDYKSTTGVDFATKVLEHPEIPRVRLHLWDLAGQEHFRSLVRVYFKGAVGCVIVCSYDNPQSFEAVSSWKSYLDEQLKLPSGAPLPCLLLANKCDLPPEKRHFQLEDVARLAEECEFVSYAETSAKINKNVDQSMLVLAKLIISNADNLIEPPTDEDIKRLHLGTSEPSKCAC